jgi:hypothetical protein
VRALQQNTALFVEIPTTTTTDTSTAIAIPRNTEKMVNETPTFDIHAQKKKEREWEGNGEQQK